MLSLELHAYLTFLLRLQGLSNNIEDLVACISKSHYTRLQSWYRPLELCWLFSRRESLLPLISLTGTLRVSQTSSSRFLKRKFMHHSNFCSFNLDIRIGSDVGYNTALWLPTDIDKQNETNRMVTAAEDINITTGYTDYFPADGMQTTLTIHCVGATNIQKCKESFLVNGRQLVVSAHMAVHEQQPLEVPRTPQELFPSNPILKS